MQRDAEKPKLETDRCSACGIPIEDAERHYLFAHGEVVIATIESIGEEA